MKVFVCESVEDHAAGTVYCVATSVKLVADHIRSILPSVQFEDVRHCPGQFESWELSEKGASVSCGYTFDICEFDLIEGERG